MRQPDIEAYTFRRTRTRVYDTKNDPNALLTSLLDVICPAGTLIPTLRPDEPGEGWKICDGQSLPKSGFPRLYAIIGGAFGETADTFALPDLRGRLPIGAGSVGELMATGGAASVVLSVENLPPHAHGITDPGHSHGFTADAHSHAVTDPGHAHTAASVGAALAAGGADVAVAAPGSTASAATGISVGSATVTGTIGTGTTSITVGSTGAGEAVDILPPFIAVNWMVRT